MAEDPKDPKVSAEQAAKEAERITKTLNSLKISFQEVASQLGNVKLNINTEGVASLDAMKEAINQINQAATENLGIDSTRLDLGISSLENLENMAKRQLALGKMNKDEYDQIVKSVGEKKKKYEYSKQDVEESKKAFENSLMLNKDTFQLSQKLKVINGIKNANLTVEEKANYKRQFALALMTAMVDKINDIATASLKTALALDDSVRELMRGANFTYQEALDNLMEMAPMAAASGLGIKEMTSSMIALKQEFSGFTTLNKEQQVALTTTVGQLEKMGLAASASAGFLDTATKSLAMSETQATSFLTSLKGFADETGITMQQLGKNIAGSREQIVKFGQDGPKVFKEMSLASKQLGIELNTLFDITERFTTFEGAADAAGKLNAILGGDFINSVDLLTAGLEDPTEAFRILKFGMDESGKSFMDLDNASRRAIAAAAGLTLEQASRIFTMDINSATAAMRDQEKTQKEMAKISGDMAGIQERLQKAFIALYPAIKPIIITFAELAEKFTEFMIGIAEYIKENPKLVTVLQGLAVSFVVIMSAMAALATVVLPVLTVLASLKAVGMSLGFIYGALRHPIVFLRGALAAGIATKQADVVATGEQAAAEEVSAAAKMKSARASRAKAAAMRSSMLSMAGVAVGLGVLLVGVGAAAYGVGHLAASFKDLGDDAYGAVAGIVAFGAAVAIVLSAVGSLAGTGIGAAVVAAGVAILLSFGAAAMMMGEGIKNAGGNIKNFTDGIPGLLKGMAELTPNKMKPWKELGDIIEKMAKSLAKASSYTSVLSKMAVSMSTGGLVTPQAKMASNLPAATEGLMTPQAKVAVNQMAVSEGLTTSQVTFVNPTIKTIAVNTPKADNVDTGTAIKKQDTSAMVAQKEMTINIVMDSPIKLNGEAIGRISSKTTQKILNNNRSNTITVNLPPSDR